MPTSAPGWAGMITWPSGGDLIPPPFTPPRAQPSFFQRARNVVVGAETLVDWITSGAEAVPPPQANARAAICAACPLNEAGDLLKFFTLPVAAAIRRAYNLRRDWKLETAFDERLGVCGACDCVTKLLVHIPLATKLAHISAPAKAKLNSSCWITAEEKGQIPK